MKKQALLITIKNPVLGKVKTRLAAGLGREKALEIYLSLVRHTCEVALQTEADRYLYYSDFVDETDEWPSDRFYKKAQTTGDIGHRMSRCFEETLPLYEKAILVGSDIPGLSAGILAEAFEKLSHNDFVIGPAEDGGYYLIGMKAFYPTVFEQITWSVPTVFEETIQQMEALGKSWSAVKTLSDVDNVDDWEKHGWEI